MRCVPALPAGDTGSRYSRIARATDAWQRAVKQLAVIGQQMPECGAAQTRCAFSSIASNTGARSPGEELMTCKHLGGRGLLLQGLARLGDQPRVLHRDDRLRREVLQQRDLLVGERADLLAVDVSTPSRVSSLAQRDAQAACERRRSRPAHAVEIRLVRYTSSLAISVTWTSVLAGDRCGLSRPRRGP